MPCHHSSWNAYAYCSMWRATSIDTMILLPFLQYWVVFLVRGLAEHSIHFQCFLSLNLNGVGNNVINTHTFRKGFHSSKLSNSYICVNAGTQKTSQFITKHTFGLHCMVSGCWVVWTDSWEILTHSCQYRQQHQRRIELEKDRILKGK